MTEGRVGALALTAVLALGACGTTYVETAATQPDPTNDAGVDRDALPSTIADDAPLPELLAEIERLMSDLDERIIVGRDHGETFGRIEALWTVAERQIRAADPNDVFNFEQAIELARSGVERRRPADASKGYKIFVDVADAYGAR